MTVPVKLVIDCSNAGTLPSDQAEAIATEMEQTALEMIRDATPETLGVASDRAATLIRQANDTRAASDAVVEQVVPLTPDEVAQRDIDQAAAAKQTQADAAAAVAQATLAAKLAKGSATSAEVQQALAQLLG